MNSTDHVGRERILLDRLAAAADRSLTASALAPAKFTNAYRAAGFSGRDSVVAAVADLTTAGRVTQAKGKRSVVYTLTDAGADYLASLPPAAQAPIRRGDQRSNPPRPPKPIPELPENANLLPYQQAYLLTQLLSADGRTLTDGQANKLPKVAKEDLELTGPLASQLRRKLAADGYVSATKAGRSLHLTLTDAGLAHLITLPHHPAGVFAVSGAALNAIVETASTTSGIAPASSPARDPAPANTNTATGTVPAGLGSAAYAAFRELARERFSRNGLVPIFEVRREIARRHGPAAARHDVLDVPILQLRKERKIRLISISDTRGAAPNELEESISNGYETLFYMEDADARSGPR